MTRTPDEIKKALECCFYDSEQCADCPYYPVSCDVELVRDAREYIRQLEAERDAAMDAVPRWISVEERLPGSDYDWVLAIGKFVPENTYGMPIISELRKDGKWWGDINDEFPLEDMGIRITHWMPLPEPPKED